MRFGSSIAGAAVTTATKTTASDGHVDATARRQIQYTRRTERGDSNRREYSQFGWDPVGAGAGKDETTEARSEVNDT
jgi:hypothetical protein